MQSLRVKITINHVTFSSRISQNSLPLIAQFDAKSRTLRIAAGSGFGGSDVSESNVNIFRKNETSVYFKHADTYLRAASLLRNLRFIGQRRHQERGVSLEFLGKRVPVQALKMPVISRSTRRHRNPS